jgi:hypothetical protein
MGYEENIEIAKKSISRQMFWHRLNKLFDNTENLNDRINEIIKIQKEVEGTENETILNIVSQRLYNNILYVSEKLDMIRKE